MRVPTNPTWPVLTTYDAGHLARIALPLGGIGTGTVSLGGRGDLRDWEIVNHPAKGFVPKPTMGEAMAGFFALWARPAGGEPVTRALEGPLDASLYEGAWGASVVNHGLPRFENCRFAAAYPFGQVLLNDPDMPVDVRIEAFNPLVPADADASGIPAAILRFVLINRTNKRVSASICGSVVNFIGTDGTRGVAKGNVNAFRKAGGVRGISMSTRGAGEHAEQFGTMALTTTAPGELTHWLDWPANRRGWGGGPLAFWDDFSANGKLSRCKPGGSDSPQGFLTAPASVPPRGEKAVTFLLTWHFPNRRGWMLPSDADDCGCAGKCRDKYYVGNYYAEQYRDAWDVARKLAGELPALERDTIKFVRAVVETDLPHEVRESALYNLSTLRTQTCFRTPDGHFFGHEGCADTQGCCDGNCTHVWNYEHATAMLFGGLAQSMRDVEFAHATEDSGRMSFRAALPLDRAQISQHAAADGQMGCLMKMYRDWQLGGDDDFLRRLWPNVKKALEFCWLPGGWDADRDGVMEGCQHNTMDVEYFGPNAQMTGWYLGALRAAAEMAAYLGEDDFADTCGDLFKRGSKWMDANLFNGQYYEHEIRPPKKGDFCQPGLGFGPSSIGKPDWQLGSACLVDQLVGQYTAHLVGLGYLHRPANVRKTLRSIMKYNWRGHFFGHFNSMRSFVLGHDQALLMASYPLGRRPTQPFPYFSEVMTGFEYTAAVGMLQEGQTAAGLKVIRAIRARYDGKHRSPFNEAECGHHYARAMASWSALLTLTGFRYSGVDKTITFAAAEPGKGVTWFWSNGYAWGTVKQKQTGKKIALELTVLHGKLTLRKLTLTGWGEVQLERPRTVRPNRAWRISVAKA